MAALDVKPVDLEAAARATGLSLSELQLLREHKDQVTELLEQLKKADDKARSQAERVGGSSVPAGSRQVSERSFRREGVQGLEDDSRPRRGPIVSPDSSRDRVATGIRERQELRPPQPRFQAVPAARSEAKDSVARTFLQEEYGGRCQICGFTFAKTNGQPYFEGLYLAPGLRGQWLDRPGNVLCLCANCCAKMQFGAIDNEIILGRVPWVGCPPPRLRHSRDTVPTGRPRCFAYFYRTTSGGPSGDASSRKLCSGRTASCQDAD